MSDLSQIKLKKLVELEGFDDDLDLIEAAIADSVCPAICMNDGCDYTTDMEPDQDRGWCESCGTNSVKSALVLDFETALGPCWYHLRARRFCSCPATALRLTTYMMLCECGRPIEIPVPNARPMGMFIGRRLCDDCILLLDHVTETNAQLTEIG